jgi:hypothetical protein
MYGSHYPFALPRRTVQKAAHSHRSLIWYKNCKRYVGNRRGREIEYPMSRLSLYETWAVTLSIASPVTFSS